MDNFEHCSAHVTYVEQDGLLLKIHAQLSSADSTNVTSRIDQISGHLRRARGRPEPGSVGRGSLAFARLGEDRFLRVKVIADPIDSQVLVHFIDYGRQERLDLTDLVVVDAPLSDVLTTVQPLAREFFLDGLMLPHRSLTPAELLVLSERLEYRTFACRIRRVGSPGSGSEFALIELATGTGRSDVFSNSVAELGLGTKVTTDDIAKYLRIKTQIGVDSPTMQPPPGPVSPYLFSAPPPQIIGMSQVQPMQPLIGQMPPVLPGALVRPSSVNERLNRYKKDGSVGMYHHEIGHPQPLADRKQQYVGSDARTCTSVPQLPVNSTHAAYISHIEDGPYHFFVQLKSSVDEFLPKLRSIISRYPATSITNQAIIPGSVIMARGGDETYKRGVIMNVQTETCKVYYIDFGNTEELAYSNIFALPNGAVELSQAMAMQFCLVDVKSLNLTDQNKQYFARLVSNKLVTIRVTEKESKAPFQYCEIIADGRNVRDVLANLNSPMQYSYQCPPRGREAMVLVIHVDSPSQFFVHYKSEVAATAKIQEALAQYCPSQPRITDINSVSIGSPVGAIYPEDKKWYRALVMGMSANYITVSYVDYGNRHEVLANDLCHLCPDLVNQWKCQAVECCLIGFDRVSPQLSLAQKMADATLERDFTLRLHSIASGFRLNVDLIDEHGNSIANMMKNYLNEKQRPSEMYVKQPVLTEKKHEDDKLSQHSSNSIKASASLYEPPPVKNLKNSPEPSDSGGGRKNKFQRPGQRGEKREKYDDRPYQYSQHDDRSANDYKQRQGTRQEWKTGVRKPYMDAGDEDMDNGDKPFVRREFGDGASRSNASYGERKSNYSNRYERRTTNDDSDQGDRGMRNQRDKKFEPRESRYGSDNDYTRENKFANREGKFGGGYRGNKFSEQNKTESRLGDRVTRDRDQKFGNRDDRYSDKGKKYGNSINGTSVSSLLATNNVEMEDEWDCPEKSSPRRLESVDSRLAEFFIVQAQRTSEHNPILRESVVISEYSRQDIKIGQEYQVLYAMMEKTPQHVYVQLNNCDPTLDKIRQMIDSDTDAVTRTVTEKEAILAMPVLARFKDDGLLYRAAIKSRVSSGNVEVLYVDYGNTDIVPLSELFKITAEQMSIPIQALHINVTDVPSSDSPVLDACEVHFQLDCLTLKPSRTVIVDLEQVVEGTLYRTDGSSIAECLKNDPLCGVGPCQEPQKSAPPELPEQSEPAVAQPVKEDVIRVEPVTVQETILPTSPSISAATPKIAAAYWLERLDLLVNQRLEAQVMNRTEDNCYTIKITACLDLIVPARSEDSISSQLNPGDKVIVDVFNVSDSALSVKFYSADGKSLGVGNDVPAICPMPIVRRSGTFIICHKENDEIFLQDENNSSTLSSLAKLLSDQYSTSKDSSSSFTVGDFCAAKSEDGSWYRASILAISGSTLTVRFFDYGNAEDVLVENVRPLDSSLMMPELCAKVILPLKYKDLQGCFDTLSDEPIHCTFIQRVTTEGPWYADLFDDSNNSYALSWINEGKAESVKNPPADPKLRNAGWSLKVGDLIPIVVSHFDSLSYFFAQIRDQLLDIHNLESKIQDLPSESVDSDMFAAKYEQDLLWYRAVAAGDLVFYIDHGNTDEASEMRKLPEEFKLPAAGFAIPLHLCVAPVGTEWTVDACNIFEDFISHEDLMMRVKSLDFKNVVDLQSGDQLLSSVLIDGGHAKPILKIPLAPTTDSQLGSTSVPDLNKEESKDTNIETSTTPQEHLPAQHPVDKDLYQNCTMVHLNGPYDFFVQTDDNQIKIDEMANSLFEAASFPKLSDVKKGDFVIAQFVDDDAYYRAVVTDVEPETVVHFVDYGNNCPATAFHELPAALRNVPKLALRCSLQSPVGGWSVDAIDKFATLMNDKTTSFDLKIIARGDPNIVDIEVDGKSVTQLLDPGAKFETATQPQAGAVKLSPIGSKPTLRETGYCFICYMDDNVCYVQDEESYPDVERIMEFLQTVDITDENQELKDVKVGEVVVSLFEDSLYRAIVTGVNPLEVFFIDYGNVCVVEKCFKTPPPLKEINPLAIKVNLYLGDGMKLNEAGCAELTILADQGADYKLKRESTIELSINGSNVAELLKEYLVSSEPQMEKPVDQTAEPSSDAMSVPPEPALSESQTKPAATETPVDPKPSEPLAGSTPIEQTPSPPQTELPPSELQTETSTEPIETAAIETPLPEDAAKSKSFEIQMSYVVSPSTFYYQVDVNKVGEVGSRLSAAEKEFETIDNCEVGQVICALFDEDSEWYRAKVIKSKPTVTVFFLDYGNSSEVQQLRKLPEDLANLEPLCVKASLESPAQPWTEEEIDKFIEVAYSTTFTCTVIGEDADQAAQIVSIESPSTGEMLTHLGRNALERTEDSVYLTPTGSDANYSEAGTVDFAPSSSIDYINAQPLTAKADLDSFSNPDFSQPSIHNDLGGESVSETLHIDNRLSNLETPSGENDELYSYVENQFDCNSVKTITDSARISVAKHFDPASTGNVLTETQSDIAELTIQTSDLPEAIFKPDIVNTESLGGCQLNAAEPFKTDDKFPELNFPASVKNTPIAIASDLAPFISSDDAPIFDQAENLFVADKHAKDGEIDNTATTVPVPIDFTTAMPQVEIEVADKSDDDLIPDNESLVNLIAPNEFLASDDSNVASGNIQNRSDSNAGICSSSDLESHGVETELVSNLPFDKIDLAEPIAAPATDAEAIAYVNPELHSDDSSDKKPLVTGRQLPIDSDQIENSAGTDLDSNSAGDISKPIETTRFFKPLNLTDAILSVVNWDTVRDSKSDIPPEISTVKAHEQSSTEFSDRDLEIVGTVDKVETSDPQKADKLASPTEETHWKISEPFQPKDEPALDSKTSIDSLPPKTPKMTNLNTPNESTRTKPQETPATGPLRKAARPVKTVAEIKASAKSRISTGRSVTAPARKKTSKQGDHAPEPSRIPSKEKIVPGCVLGNV